MKDFLNIFRFGWPYLKRYWFRLATGIILGIIFGLSNASFILATRALVERLTPKSNDTLLVPQTAVTTLNISFATNSTHQLSLSNGLPGLTLSNDALIRIEVDTNIAAATLASSSETKVPGKKKFAFLDKIAARVGAAVDPWLPSLNSPNGIQRIIGGFLFLPLLIAFRGYTGYLSSYCMTWVSERVIRDLRMDVLKKLNTFSLDYFNRATIGELLSRVNGDTAALYRCLTMGFSDLVKEPITVVVILATLFWMNWKLTLMAVIFMPLTLIPIRILGKKVRKAIVSTMTAGMTQDSLLVEVFSSIRVVKAFCLEKMQLARFSHIYDDLVRIGTKSVQARDLVNPMVETISALGLGMVIVFIFLYKVSIPDLMGFLIGVTTMYTPIKKLGNLHVFFQQASVGATRLVELFNEMPTVKEKADAKPISQFSKEIKFENVSFAYPDRGTMLTKPTSTPVVRDLTLTISRGMKLGIAGESGCGKSTLVNLIFRFYDPVKGRITFDGTDLRDVGVYDLRQQMALVSQEVVVFDQTIAENIACGREGATRAEVEAAAKSAFAHEFIMQMPLGYETRVGERGATLSGGQKQRLCIARAFVRNAPILVLDEATASLDPKAEGEVQAAIDRLAQNRTVICIAHRLSTLATTDQVIVMSDGKIVEQGRFSDLVRSGGPFSKMAAKQGITSGR